MTESLGKRIKRALVRAKYSHPAGEDVGKSLADLSALSKQHGSGSQAIAFVFTVMVSVGLGIVLDYFVFTGTSPLFMILGLIFGFVVGFIRIVRES